MARFFLLLTLFAFVHPVWAHGPGGHEGTYDHESLSRAWEVSLETGWESRHVHYGVNETGNGGAWVTEASAQVKGLIFSVWSGFGTGNDYQEWDFSVAHTFDLGPVFFMPGYNFWYIPGIVESGHEEDGEHHDEHAEHAHTTYSNEVFFVLGAGRIPYVTPNMVFVWNLNDAPGGFMEFRLDGEAPLWKDRFSLKPYAMLGLNFGYNTQDYYGWNNVQTGVEASWKINSVVRIFGGVNYSVALRALEEMGQGNETWVSAGISVAY